jgi:uncharacterized membrane protein
MWSAVEINVGIICACIPTLKPLIARLLPRMLGDGTERHVVSSGHPQSAAASGTGRAHNRSTPYASNNNIQHSVSQTRLTSSSETSPNVGESVELKPTSFATASGKGTDEIVKHGCIVPQSTSTATGSRPGPNIRRPTILGFNSTTSEKSMVKLTNRESCKPVLLVTTLFFLWGFAYGLLGSLNGQIQGIIHITAGQTVALSSTYFAAYFVSPMAFGYWILEKYGFKATFITGLCIYSTGSMIFWPSAVLLSFPAFLVSNFIVALGLSTLEIAANPFISLCGPPEYAEVRLNLAQAIQAVGVALSPLLATLALFKNVRDVGSLIDTQWTYLAIALFVAFLAVVFYYYPLPEAS